MATRRPTAPRPRAGQSAATASSAATRTTTTAASKTASSTASKAASKTATTSSKNATGKVPAPTRGPARAAARPASRPGARSAGRTSSRSGSRAGSRGAGASRRPSRSARAARSRPPVIRPMTAVAGVLVVLALLIAPYVRPWISQRSQISAAQEELARLQKDVGNLTAERERWNDPAYVAAQARYRLKYVNPGEIAFALLDDTAAATVADPRVAAVAVPHQDVTRPWYDTLWGSVTSAGDPTTRQPPRS